jgi:hypothetical protein
MKEGRIRLYLASTGLFVCLLAGVPSAVAQQASSPTALRPAATELAAVKVTGVQPGPGLWKVSKGDHVMWVLGTMSPLPRTMTWRSAEVEQALGHSQQLLQLPSVKVKADVGFFGKLFLLPAALSARRNDDGKTLQQVLPPPIYARWLQLKQQYIGHDNGIEHWRPVFAARELHEKALKAHGLARGGIDAGVAAMAKRFGVAEVPVTIEVTIAHPRDAIKSFKQNAPHDTTCFIRMLDSVQHDLPAMTARANAWASGDLQTLRTLPDSEWRDACVSALTNASFAHQLGIDDVPARLRTSWLAAARAAMQRNSETFALLPIDELLKPDGYLAALQLAGYQVEAPE